MARQLKNLRIDEVSSVDRGAGRGVVALLMKRDLSGTAQAKSAVFEKALELTIASIFDDAAVTDKAAALADCLKQFATHTTGTDAGHQESNAMPTLKEIAKQLSEALAKAVAEMTPVQKAFYDALPVEKQGAFAEMDTAERDAAIKAFPPKKPAAAAADDKDEDDAKKKAAAKNAADDLAKKNVDTEIAKRDAEILKRDEQIAALTKSVTALTEKDQLVEFGKRAVGLGLAEADGDTLLKAHRGDPAALTKIEDMIKALTTQVAKGGLFNEFGSKVNGATGATAYDQLVAKAGEIRKVDPKLTAEQAFDKAMADPANIEIVRAEKRERDARVQRAA